MHPIDEYSLQFQCTVICLQVETDSFFYIVDSERKEKALSDVILKGTKMADKKMEETPNG